MASTTFFRTLNSGLPLTFVAPGLPFCKAITETFLTKTKHNYITLISYAAKFDDTKREYICFLFFETEMWGCFKNIRVRQIVESSSNAVQTLHWGI